MFAVALSALLLVAVLALVGGALAWSVGLRGYWLIGATAPFGLSSIAISSTLAPVVGLDWSILPLVVMTAVLVAGISAIRLKVLRSAGAVTSDDPPRLGWILVAITGAAALLAWRVVAVFGGSEAISQTFDNVFHLNAVRYILDAGSASSLDVGGLTGAMGFYPAVWHATAALAVQLAGVSVPAAVQAVTLVVCAAVWPLSAMLLTSALFGSSRAVLLSTAVVVTAIPAFPLLMMDYGVLYPFQLSLALLPAALAFTVRMLAQRKPGDGASGWWVFSLLGTLPGLMLSHPGGFVAWLALSVPLFFLFFLRQGRAAVTVRSRLAVAACAAAYLGAGYLLIKVLRPALEARLWPPVMSTSAALWQVASVSAFTGVSAVLIAVAVIAGGILVVLKRSPALWASFGIWAVGGLLFVVAASIDHWLVRDTLTGSWYNNWPRLAAVFAVAVVPLAVAGLVGAVRVVARAYPRVAVARAGSAATIVGFVICAAAAQIPAMPAAQEAAHRNYVMSVDAKLLSPDELALLQRLTRHVPEDAVIAGNPYTGTALAYAYADRQVLMPHMLMYLTADGHAVNDGLDDAADDPRVCQAVLDLGVTHVLDFGDREVHGGHHDYPGLDDLAASAAVALVDEQGDARLYRVRACGLG
ncbi:DUF6541 family protein [Microbacterium sp. YJN-G]|uniref:DUF6541 family protein n=1 Tax=Microbacterium sp. YJN-G TaxID=2763257 RepID=UPI0029D419DC|nr:DUF6541 family protein [Microbacterium sp. YJN-G]